MANLITGARELAGVYPSGCRKTVEKLCDALEESQEQNKQLMHEVCKLACESVEREKTLARLEAEVEGWAKADQEGRLVVLPCKVGDTVYTVDLDCEDNPDHTKMCFCWNKSCKSCEKAYLRVWENRTKTVDIRSIVAEMGLCGEDGGFGKTVFLTRAEAEEALKGGTA